MKLDFEVTGHIWKGTEEVEENAYPWMAFIYSSYVRAVLDWVKTVTILTESLPVSSLLCLIFTITIHKMGHCCVGAGVNPDPARDGILNWGIGKI